MTCRRLYPLILITSLLVLTGSLPVAATEMSALSLPAPFPFNPGAQATSTRSVNAPYFSGDLDWSQTAIFWLGQNEQGDPPTRNYTDVRVGYGTDALQIRATVADYYLWYDENANSSSDLTQYDAVALYLDTTGDRASTPQLDDYRFLIGARFWEDVNNYVRLARGNGSGWNTFWTPPTDWSAQSVMSWSCNPGPNDNECGLDFGLTAIFTIPWETLGLSGKPADGTRWSLGVQVYDRDQSSGAPLAPETWPETFSDSNPSTWGTLTFNAPAYEPPAAPLEGTTTIRRATESDTSVVQDAWVGGGAWCSGGHHGGADTNHGGLNPDGSVKESELFAGSEVAVTHLPCFNKSLLRFYLDDVPPDKVILSATLTLHHWGNSGDPNATKDEDRAHDSYVWLYSVSDPWSEMEITWNSAPLAQKNLDVVRIPPVSSHPGWPGIPYTWDATEAVAAAYAMGQPVSLALYDSASQRNTTKYFLSSETGDWNAQGRPTLTITWGRPTADLIKTATPSFGNQGDSIAYTLDFVGTDKTLTLTDTLPEGVNIVPGSFSLEGTSVTPAYDSDQRRLTWSDNPEMGQQVTIRYEATIVTSQRLALLNTAELSETGNEPSSDTAIIIANPYQIHLPLIFK